MNLLQGIQEFCKLQTTLSSSSAFARLKPKSVTVSHREHILDVLTEFKAFCLPKFLQKDDTDIYMKMFHERLSKEMKTQLTRVAANLSDIHQTFSTKGKVMMLEDLDMVLMR